MRMLLVEDSDSDRYMLKRFLRPYASSFCEAVGVEEAFELCRENTFDCIILDLLLEGSTSVDDTLTRIHELKRLQPDAGLIVCSGMPVPELKEKSLEAGADYFLQKNPEMYRNSAKALLIAVCAAMMHHGITGRTESFMAHTRLLQEIAGMTQTQ